MSPPRSITVSALVLGLLLGAGGAGATRSHPSARHPSSTVDVTALDLDARHGPRATTIHIQVHATTRDRTHVLRFAYCGPPPTVLSVEGSTVDFTLGDGTLDAPLDVPRAAGTPIRYRLLTLIPSDDAVDSRAHPSDLAAGVLCSGPGTR